MLSSPSVVTPGAKHIDLVAATRSLLGLPKITGFRIYGEPVTISMTARKDPWLELGAPDEGVVVGNAAVVA